MRSEARTPVWWWACAQAAWRWTAEAVLVIGAILCLIPLLWMLLTSLKPSTVPGTQILVPLGALTLDNYIRVAERIPVARLLFNSAFVAAAAVLAQLAIGVPAAYALARMEFPGRDLVRWIILSTLMVPVHAVVLPVYILLNAAGLIDTYHALVLPFAASGFGIFLLHQFFLSIPRSLLEAARVDGLSEWKIAWTVVVPLARPAIAAFAIFSVVTRWNDLFWPLMMTRGLERAPVTAGLAYFLGVESGRDWGAQMALATLAVLPLLAGFAMAQRRFVQGIALSGLRE